MFKQDRNIVEKMAHFWSAAVFVSCLLCAGVVSQGDTTCYERADILFVMDGSGSIGAADFQKQLQFAATFINKFDVGQAQFSVLRFDSTPSIIFDFNDYLDQTSLRNAILNIRYTGGGTNTADALKMAREQAFLQTNGARRGVARIVIVSTDGQSNNPPETAREAQSLKNSSVLVLAMGIGKNAAHKELDAIASYPEDVFEVPDYDHLLSIVQDYSELVCSEVKLFKCYNDSDIYFLLDSSSGISPAYFQNAVLYAQNITTRFDLSVFSFGAATFGGSTVQSLFKLGQISDRYQLAQTFSTAAYLGGATDINAALQYVLNQRVFDPSLGGRPNAIKILVIFTNGGSATRPQAVSTANQLKTEGVNIIAVGVSSPNIQELQELVVEKALDVVTNLGNTNIAAGRLQTLTAAEVCTLPTHAVRGAEDACRLYNWENGIHPHPYDCTKYIECTFLRTDIMPCPPDLAYDPDIQTCNYPGAITTPCNAVNRNTTYPPLITPAPTTAKPCVKGTLDILYLLDSSASVGNPGYGEILRFAANLPENFHIGPNDIEFAATIFGTNPVNLFDFNVYNDYKSLQQAILNATYLGGSTNTHLVLQNAKNIFTTAHGARDGAPKLAIVFTSGKSSDDQRTVQQATDLKNAGIHVISVGFANPNIKELQAIASSPSEAFVNNFDGVLQAILKYSNSTCLVTSCVGIQFADVIFVIDSSNSITDSEYKTQLTFVADVTDNFLLGVNDVRFGAIVFSQSPVKLFDLDDFISHDRLRSAILSAQHLKSGTDTAQALNYVSDNRMFEVGTGGRDNATKILIIMTDGRSNSVNNTILAAQRLKAAGVTFIAIGIGDEFYLEELRLLASDSQNLFTVPGFAALNQIKDSVTRRTCEIPKDTPNVPDYSYLCASFRWADGKHPNPYDCSTYIVCSSFVTSVFSCEVGQAYDPAQQQCRDKASAHPCNDPAYAGPTLTLPPIATTRAPVATGNICNYYSLVDGIYPDPGNCVTYVECTAFDTKIMPCPEGLNFNTVNSVCDDVHAVDCNINYNYYTGMNG